MKLSAEEERMLSGKMGPAMEKALKLQIAVGDVYGAEIMLWTTGKLGAHAREYTMETLGTAQRFSVNTTINPYNFDPDLLREFGFPQSHIDDMRSNIEHGLVATLVC